jgi:hypothetical protein
LQLEEGSVDLFSKTVKDDGIEIDMQANESLKIIDRYVQAWRNQIWDHGFMGWFKREVHIVSLRHLRSTGTWTLLSSVFSSGMKSFLK